MSKTFSNIIRKLTVAFLALVIVVGMLPSTVLAAESDLPDWYFLFAIFENVDADGVDKYNKKQHTRYTMTQDEIDYVKSVAPHFETFMTKVGVMYAHVDVIEIDVTVTELQESIYGSYLGPEQAFSLLQDKTDLDRYDHVSCVISLNDLVTGYAGITGPPFENGTGHSCINLQNREFALNVLRPEQEGPTRFPSALYVHEFLHFAEQLSRKAGHIFNQHSIFEKFYTDNYPDPYACSADIILNQVKGDAETGTGVYSLVWQYPPHVVRSLHETMHEVTIPSDITIVGDKVFQFFTNLSKVNIHSGVTSIGIAAFEWCTSLTEVTIPSSVTSIGDWAFQGCTALTKVFIPVSVTDIGEVAFYHTGLTDVYYSGTKTQWENIKIGEYNEALTGVTIHYNSSTNGEAIDWWNIYKESENKKVFYKYVCEYLRQAFQNIWK